MAVGQAGLHERRCLLRVLSFHNSERAHGKTRHTAHQRILDLINITESSAAIAIEVQLLFQVFPEVNVLNEGTQESSDVRNLRGG